MHCACNCNSVRVRVCMRVQRTAVCLLLKKDRFSSCMLFRYELSHHHLLYDTMRYNTERSVKKYSSPAGCGNMHSQCKTGQTGTTTAPVKSACVVSSYTGNCFTHYAYPHTRDHAQSIIRLYIRLSVYLATDATVHLFINTLEICLLID